MTSVPDDRFDRPVGSDSSSGSDEPCAKCGSQPASTQSFMWIMSFLVFTRHARYEALLCRRCATRLSLKEHAKSSILGWWGIPWGVLTLQALWVNTRTMWRWSSLGPVGVLLVGSFGLSLPAAVGYYVYDSMRDESLARATGDWVDDDVAELVEQGHIATDEQGPEAALPFYLQALERAPESSVINYQIASALYRIQRFDEALPYAAKAEAMAGESISNRALHGCLLLILGQLSESEARAEALADRVPADDEDAYWLVELYWLFDDYEMQVKMASAALRLDPTDEYYIGIKIDALLNLDRVEEVGELLDALPPGAVEGGNLALHVQLYRMRTSPLEETDRVLERWVEGVYGYDYMERLAGAAERSGDAEAVRVQVEAWLMDAETPSEAWRLARPWFEDDEWIPALDRYLAVRTGVWPTILRIEELDVIADAETVLDLARRSRGTDDPATPYLDAIFFTALSRTRSRAAAMEATEAHVAEWPDHTMCLYRLARDRFDEDPAAARALLDRVEQASADDPGMLAELELTRFELVLVDGGSSAVLEAVARFDADAASPYRSPEHVRLLLAEAAFHSGDLAGMHERLDQVRESGSAGAEAAAMLVGWSAQWASGELPDYSEDVTAWLAAGEEALRTTESLTAQGILLAEGVVDRAWARRVTLDGPDDTLRLVAAIKKTSLTGELADADLDPIAHSRFEGGFAHRLARTILNRRASSGG